MPSIRRSSIAGSALVRAQKARVLGRSANTSGLTIGGIDLGGIPVIGGVPIDLFPSGPGGPIATLPNGTPIGGGQTPIDFAPQSCPDGFELVNGVCQQQGLGGTIGRMIPGGNPGQLPAPTQQSQAVVGAFGTPAMLPFQAGTITRSDGSQGAILRCPTGFVLGKDDLCYVKSSIPRQFRKWAPAPRPPVSASDAKAIRKAESAKKRVKRLATNVGFSCTNRKR